ncbi:protein FAM, partial [Clarias magur]
MMQRVLCPAASPLRSVCLNLNTRDLGVCANILHIKHFTARCLSVSGITRNAESHKTRPEDQRATPRQEKSQGELEVSPQSIRDLDPLQDKSIGLVQRFKKTFKQYGKVMVPVHIVTSTVWFGTFYYAAMKGVNLVPFLEFIGLPDKLVGILRDSQGGYALTAYAMYK